MTPDRSVYDRLDPDEQDALDACRAWLRLDPREFDEDFTDTAVQILLKNWHEEWRFLALEGIPHVLEVDDEDELPAHVRCELREFREFLGHAAFDQLLEVAGPDTLFNVWLESREFKRRERHAQRVQAKARAQAGELGKTL